MLHKSVVIVVEMKVIMEDAKGAEDAAGLAQSMIIIFNMYFYFFTSLLDF
jgi:hypothetical protein